MIAGPPGFSALPTALIDSAAVVALVMAGLWLVSMLRRDASLVDLAWGGLFVVSAWTAWLYHHAGSLRAPLVVGCVTIWGLRLSLYLTWRNAGEPEDRRYAAMRARRPAAFWWWSLVFVFGLQAALSLVIGLPVTAAIVADSHAPWSLLDAAATAIWGTGLLCESVADWQLARFRAAPRASDAVLDTGLWRYSRHPNYFGDALAWVGLGLFGVAAGAWWALIGPAVMIWLLLRVSGVALLERDIADRRPAYADYVRRTSAFVPWPPRSPSPAPPRVGPDATSQDSA